jgi:hypothetical protein
VSQCLTNLLEKLVVQEATCEVCGMVEETVTHVILPLLENRTYILDLFFICTGYL